MNPVPFTPYASSSVGNSFQIKSDGYIQGMARPDPAIQNELAAGVLSSAETVPMFGGVAIQELIAATGANTGGNVKRAVSDATLTGFCVSNQNSAAIKTPSSQV